MYYVRIVSESIVPESSSACRVVPLLSSKEALAAHGGALQTMKPEPFWTILPR
jgi:hypothetical protein